MNEHELHSIGNTQKSLGVSYRFMNWLIDHYSLKLHEYRKISSNSAHKYLHIDDVEFVKSELETNGEQLKEEYQEYLAILRSYEEEDEKPAFSDAVLAKYKINFYKSLVATKISEDEYQVVTKTCNDCPSIEEQLTKQQLQIKIRTLQNGTN
jgi:hypothetical protein